MFQKWIRRDIDGQMSRRSLTATQASIGKLVVKGTRKLPSILKIWERPHQMKTGHQVNDRLGKTE